MVAYRNHRRFTLKCIKASITPVSCKVKNPLKTNISYEIIHKAEKQLLYERITNINNTLDMFEKNRSQCYFHLKNMINQHAQETDIEKCILFINKMKEHRHSKIKEKHINKFEHLYFKRFGYHHNLNRHTQNFNNINQDCTLSKHLYVPSSFSTTSSEANYNPSVPATPMAPHLLQAQMQHLQHPLQHLVTHFPAPGIHVKLMTAPTNGSSTCPKPSSLQNSYPFYKKAKTLP